MASLLFQERALGASLGFLAGLGALAYQRRSFWRSTVHTAHELSNGTMPLPPRVQVEIDSSPLFDREIVARAWNAGVDNVFKPLISELSSRGW